MKKVVHRADERGKGEYGWLSTRYSFSFANWHEPTRMGFGALRVLNDDTIAPNAGFPMHSHRDMEIITVITSGTLTHKDSLGNVGTIEGGEVQAMSAGDGITHSEYNASNKESLKLFQLWIVPSQRVGVARFAQASVQNTRADGGPVLVAGPEGSGAALTIAQDAYVSRAACGSKPLTYRLKRAENGLYAFVTRGTIRVAGETLYERDAIGISDASSVEFETESEAELLLIEVPL